MATTIGSTHEYHSTIDHIKFLKRRMWELASSKGNLDPDVIEVSQELDECVVSVQRYWQRHLTQDSLIV